MRSARKHSNGHLDYLRSLPCIICADNVSVEAAHIRYADASLAKPATGVGIKPDDYWCLPLCGKHHREQHAFGNERRWWHAVIGINPLPVALRLYSISGDYSGGLAVLKAARSLCQNG